MIKPPEISRSSYEAYIRKIASFIIMDNEVKDIEGWHKIDGKQRSRILYDIARQSAWTAIIPTCVATLRFTQHF